MYIDGDLPSEFCVKCGRKWRYRCELDWCPGYSGQRGIGACMMFSKGARIYSICPHLKKEIVTDGGEAKV